MKRLRFHELLLLSHTEKSARRITFDKEATVIKGKNDFGKSCLLKSLYSALGATPWHIHPSWKKLDVVLLLTFSIDARTYRILRLRDQYTIFDFNERHLWTCSSVTNELGPLFAELCDFHLQLTMQNGDAAQATPAFLFLPFYIDQDRGWIGNWGSFKNLGQFKKYRPAISQFHTGIKPNEYYRALTKKNDAEERRDELRGQREVVRKVLSKLEALMRDNQFDIDFDNYTNEIEQLIAECNKLQKDEERFRDAIVTLENQRALIIRQIEISDVASKELKRDFDFATESLGDDVECPMCGAEYHNSFAERFGIARDEDNVRALLASLREEENDISEKLANRRAAASEVRERVTAISNLLEAKQGKVRLKDVIQSEGKKEVRTVLRSELDDLNRDIGVVDGEIQDAESDMKTSSNRRRTQEINNYYRGRMTHFLDLLEVSELSGDDVKHVHSSVQESGSDLPRALLAFYFAILKTIEKFSTSTFSPIVIDSPKQQDQDEINWKKMMEFIRDHRPKGAQMIVAVVDDAGVDLGGKVIELTDKRQLLQSSQYEEVATEMRPYIDICLSY